MTNRQQFENVYDEFRTLVLNKEYYARRISKSRKILRALDIFLALFAGGSGVLSLALWKVDVMGYPVGPLLLSLTTGIALVLGIARPYLKLEDEHERLSSVQGAYGAIAYVMEDVVATIKTKQAVDETSEAIYRVLRQVRASLVAKEDTPGDRKLIDEMEKIVNQRYPAESYFYYPSSNSPSRK
ncbi:hypothetical protein ACN9MZ_27315 [Pseudoduganella sp. S-14]|uniref:hypothetical protein n=1 Tax=Pseudoduganella sp. S-14 TaxID=3404065 RepID=UPI003CF55BFD